MRHCMDFAPLDVWFLIPNTNFFNRKINIGFCPICGKPVAELREFSVLNGKCHFKSFSGVEADEICNKYKKELDYKYSSLTLAKTKSKVYGWIYGVNKLNDETGLIEQYSSDFYGNTELVKQLENNNNTRKFKD